jgi:superkiller protein 3
MAIKLDPGFVQAYNNLGYVYERLNKIEGAENAYNSAIEVAPGQWGTYYNLGGLYMRTGKPDLALQIFQKGLEITGNEKLAKAAEDAKAKMKK